MAYQFTNMPQPSWAPANEMLYANIKPNLVYNHKKYIPLPRSGGPDNRMGRGCAVFFLCPTQDATIEEIKTDYLRWYMDMYRWYTTDTYFREKIGRKYVVANMRQVIRRDWESQKFPHPLKYMTPQQRTSKLKQLPNILIDLGEWTDLYFKFSFKTTVPVVVQKYLEFLSAKLKSPEWDGYTEKVLYIPINKWFTEPHNPLGFTRRKLNNPLAIIMFASWRYPELMSMLPNLTVILGDSKNDQFLKYQLSDFKKSNFNRIKMRLKMFKGFEWDEESEKVLDATFSEEEEDENSELNNAPDTVAYSDPKKIVPEPEENASDEERAKAELKAANRARLINDMKRNLMGPDPTKPTAREYSSQLKSGTSDAVPSKAEPAKLKPATTSFSGPKSSTYGGNVKTQQAPTKTEPKTAPEPNKNEPKGDVWEKPQKTQNPAVRPSQTSANSGTKTTPSKSIGQPVVSKSLRKNEDITRDTSIYDEDEVTQVDEDTTPIHLEDEDLDEAVVDAVDEVIDEMQDEDPDVLLNEDGSLDVGKIEAKVSKKLKVSFLPEHTSAQMAKIEELQGKQAKVMAPLPTAKQLKSKVIETSDFSNAITTSNPALTHSKFVNFDRDYTEKKLQSDIDGAVAALSKAQVGIYIVGKTEEDSSTQLDLKKTVTYELEDEHGNRHSVKIDIPIIVDDKYIYINGSKLLLGHQQIMMPIVKATKDTVHIVTWYNKLILLREGVNDTRTSSVKRYIETHRDQFGFVLGNVMSKNFNEKQPSTLDIDMYAKQLTEFHIGHNRFVLDRAKLIERVSKLYPNLGEPVNTKEQIPVGYNTDRKEYIYVTSGDTLTDIILKCLPDDAKREISKNTKASERKLLRTRVKIMTKMVPLALLLMFYEGFAEVMRKAEINYSIVDKDADLHDLDRSKFDILECSDKFIIWERNPLWNTMLMNGLSEVDLSMYDFEDLEDKDTYANMLTSYFSSKSMSSVLMQYYDFMLADPATQEILSDMNLPTDLVSLLLLGNKMLADNSYTPINDARAFRVRSNEIIAEYVYDKITSAYLAFRNTQGRMGRNRKPDKINVRRDAVISAIVKDSSLTNEASVLNPILELEKARSITPRGPRGVGKQRAMTLQKRAYDPSMLGIIGMTTSPDYKVGVNRQMTLEPNITSTRGYVQITEDQDLDSLSNANLLTPAELLSPPGALHDDGPRTSMSYKQSQYMLPVAGSTPVFFGNKVESAVPYHMSREFVVTAKQDGEVVDIKDGIIVVQYKDGTYDSVDTNTKMKNNSSSGFYISNHMESHLTEVGQKFKKNEVIGRDPRAFSKNDEDIGASMNIGVPIKVAILPNYDIYEDAGPITKKLSDKFTAYMSMKEEVGIPANSYVEKMVDIGDSVKVGDPLIIYDPAHEDEETNAFLNEIRSKLGEDLTSLIDLKSMPQVRTEYAGKIAAIEVYTSVPINELSPSLQVIVKKYTKHSANVIKTLDKYKNSGDLKYYKCGQVITNSPDVIKADYQRRVKGVEIGNDGRGVVIFFYVEFKDIAKTGDKGSAFTALKFITSHVIPEGMEAYSEYRPDEEISTIIAPGAVLARKTPSIQVTMFANKCIVEMKRHALQMFFDGTDPRTKHK